MAIRPHFDKELLSLQQEILKMGILVENSISQAIEAIVNQDEELARKVISEDSIVDRMELEIEDRCTILIATEQPVAHDLRTIITILKVVSHLERMGDHGVHLAKAAIRLKPEKYMKPLIDIPRMADMVIKMIRESLSAFVKADKDEAKRVAAEDSVIDNIHLQLLRELLTYMMEDPKNIAQATSFLFVSRFLERLGDHVVDICEWIVYNSTGVHENLNE